MYFTRSTLENRSQPTGLGGFPGIQMGKHLLYRTSIRGPGVRYSSLVDRFPANHLIRPFWRVESREHVPFFAMRLTGRGGACN